jgi:hypothetical protein
MDIGTRNDLGPHDGVGRHARRGSVVAAAAALCLAAAACGSSMGTNSQAASTTSVAATSGFLAADVTGAAPHSANIGLTGDDTVLNYLPTILAMGAGYFNTVAKRFHTTISFDDYASGTLAEAALLGGTDQFSEIGTADYLPAVLEGKDTVGVLNGGVALGAVFAAAAKYESSRGTDISKFNSPTWCEIGLVGASASILAVVTGVNKLDTSKLHVTNIGSSASELPALQGGQCSIVAGAGTTAAEGVVQHIAYVPLNTSNPAESIPVVGEDLGLPLTSSLGFIQKYPQLAQAMVDAAVKGLLLIQHNINNPAALYKLMPKDAQSALTLAAFKGSFSLIKESYAAKYNNGTFTSQEIGDTVYFNEATKQIPLNAPVNPSKLFVNKLVLQAYKDLGVKPAAGSPTGPATLPTTVGKPTVEAAKAFAILTGKPAPANDGPSKILGGAAS